MDRGINYENKFVFYLDILGFKEQIKASTNSAQQINDIYNALCFKDFHFAFIDKKPPKDWKTSEFSDHIVVSFLKADTLRISLIFEIIINLIHHKMNSRGALTFGQIYHDDEIVFGPALVEAYEIESKLANYPRVLATEAVLNKLLENESSYFIQDNDGAVYMDYFNSILNLPYWGDDKESTSLHYFDNLKKAINSIPKDDIKTKNKFGWMKNKYNEAIESLFPDKIDELRI